MKKIIKCGQLFSAVNETVQKNMAILVEDQKITGLFPIDACKEDGDVIDLSDKFVMPGMIDAHVHVCLDGGPDPNASYHKLPGEITLSALVQAQKDLMAGFTTLRDEGGPGFCDIALRNAINSGLVTGPRMYVSGLGLTSTGGHADSHFAPNIEGASMGVVVNGPDEARKAARNNFKYGADQLKICATGGAVSFGDEPGAAELTFEEMKAALDVANTKGRTSSAHAHGADGIKMAIRAGITSIEHGMLIDDEAMEMMKQHDIYLIPTIIAAYRIIEHGKKGALPLWMVEKAEQCLNNHGKNIRKMLDMGIKIGFGTDAGCPFDNHGEQAFEFELMTRFGFSPEKALLSATKVNSELLRKQNSIGTLEPGKLADIIAFDSSPLEDIRVMTKCTFVMKDGVVYKS